MSTLNDILIRPATPADAAAIAGLAAQLGYTVTADEVGCRLAALTRRPEHAVYVAATPAEAVVGWIHLYVDHSLLQGPVVALGGIVVEETQRGTGIGRRLMEQAEQWGRAHDCEAVYLKTNIIRHEAHVFYESLGYRNVKTQYAYRKAL